MSTKKKPSKASKNSLAALQTELRSAKNHNNKITTAEMSAQGWKNTIANNAEKIKELEEANLLAQAELKEQEKLASVPRKNVALIEKNIEEARKGL